jgi:hypothetical protein
MNEQITSFQTILDSLLAPGRDFPRRYLEHFSDIPPLELQTLMEVWPRVKPDRKLSLLEGLDWPWLRGIPSSTSTISRVPFSTTRSLRPRACPPPAG